MFLIKLSFSSCNFSDLKKKMEIPINDLKELDNFNQESTGTNSLSEKVKTLSIAPSLNQSPIKGRRPFKRFLPNIKTLNRQKAIENNNLAVEETYQDSPNDKIECSFTQTQTNPEASGVILLHQHNGSKCFDTRYLTINDKVLIGRNQNDEDKICDTTGIFVSLI